MLYEILLILIVVAASCSLIGSLLLMSESLMVADAISHTILLGIVIAYYFTEDLSSPWLIVGASLFGVITVYSIRLLVMSGRVQNDAAIGLVFPFFFSIAVIIISKYYANVHLDIDMVLLGQVELAPLRRTTFMGMNLPSTLLISIVILVINLIFVLTNYRRLKISLFDETYARSVGIPVGVLNLILMTLVSLTAVSSFESVGSILVIALMAAPTMTARLLSQKFSHLLIGSILVASLNCCIGFWIGVQLDTSISSMVAVVSFITFLLVFIYKVSRSQTKIA